MSTGRSRDAISPTLDERSAFEKATTELNIFIGRRIRELRKGKGLSQKVLVQRLGISSQQIHKYENGTDRVGAGRLHQIADQLGIPVQEFFPEPEGGVVTPQQGGGIERDILRFLSDPLGVRLYQAFRCIADDSTKIEIIEIAEERGKTPRAPAAVAPVRRSKG